MYAYSTTEFPDQEYFLERYPGDEYVDIIGMDCYQMKPNEAIDFTNRLQKMVTIMNQVGRERNKLVAITEIGNEKIPDPKWWTDVLLPIMKEGNISYVLLWRNGRPDHYYVPYPGQISAENFKSFYSNPKTLFQKKLTDEKIYKKQ